MSMRDKPKLGNSQKAFFGHFFGKIGKRNEDIPFDKPQFRDY